jgi:hypothetical protein
MKFKKFNCRDGLPVRIELFRIREHLWIVHDLEKKIINP